MFFGFVCLFHFKQENRVAPVCMMSESRDVLKAG